MSGWLRLQGGHTASLSWPLLSTDAVARLAGRGATSACCAGLLTSGAAAVMDRCCADNGGLLSELGLPAHALGVLAALPGAGKSLSGMLAGTDCESEYSQRVCIRLVAANVAATAFLAAAALS